MTQEAMDDEDGDEDDSKVGQLKELFPDLNKMSYALKHKHTELCFLIGQLGTNLNFLS